MLGDVVLRLIRDDYLPNTYTRMETVVVTRTKKTGFSCRCDDGTKLRFEYVPTARFQATETGGRQKRNRSVVFYNRKPANAYWEKQRLVEQCLVWSTRHNLRKLSPNTLQQVLSLIEPASERPPKKGKVKRLETNLPE